MGRSPQTGQTRTPSPRRLTSPSSVPCPLADVLPKRISEPFVAPAPRIADQSRLERRKVPKARVPCLDRTEDLASVEPFARPQEPMETSQSYVVPRIRAKNASGSKGTRTCQSFKTVSPRRSSPSKAVAA